MTVHYFRDVLAYKNLIGDHGQPLPLLQQQWEHPLHPRYGNDSRVDPDGGWREFAGINPVIHPIIAEHYKILENPAINQVAAEILRVMREVPTSK